MKPNILETKVFVNVDMSPLVSYPYFREAGTQILSPRLGYCLLIKDIPKIIYRALVSRLNMSLSAFELQSHRHFVSQKVAAARASEFDQYYFRQVRACILTSVAKVYS